MVEDEGGREGGQGRGREEEEGLRSRQEGLVWLETKTDKCV